VIRLFLALIAIVALGCFVAGLQAYSTENWRTASQLFGLSGLLGASISAVQLLRMRKASNAPYQ
jgi:hypothetical protein